MTGIPNDSASRNGIASPPTQRTLLGAVGSLALAGASAGCLATGSVLASVPNIALTVPLLTPAAMELGLDPVTWAIIFIISDAIGFITPPYGLNLYIISGITDIDYMEVTYEALPYLGMLIGIWTMFFVFPELNVLA